MPDTWSEVFRSRFAGQLIGQQHPRAFATAQRALIFAAVDTPVPPLNTRFA
jgi:hypothetical protein